MAVMSVASVVAVADGTVMVRTEPLTAPTCTEVTAPLTMRIVVPLTDAVFESDRKLRVTADVGTALISFTSTVPTVVPLLFHNSMPFSPSSAVK